MVYLVLSRVIHFLSLSFFFLDLASGHIYSKLGVLWSFYQDTIIHRRVMRPWEFLNMILFLITATSISK